MLRELLRELARAISRRPVDPASYRKAASIQYLTTGTKPERIEL